MNGYELSRKWFDFCFDNPEKIKPNHTALYFFIIEHCNRLGWKQKFGLPTTMVKDAIGIKSYKTYINTLNDLVDWGFVKMVEKSKNQYSANIIALVNFTKASTKALDKAISKHVSKQVQSIDTVDKPLNQEQINSNLHKVEAEWKNVLAKSNRIDVKELNKHLEIFINQQLVAGGLDRPELEFRSHFQNWIKYQELKRKKTEVARDRVLTMEEIAKLGRGESI